MSARKQDRTGAVSTGRTGASVSSITPQGRALNQGPSPQARVHAAGATPGRTGRHQGEDYTGRTSGNDTRLHPHDETGGPPPADTAAPVQPAPDGSAKTVHSRPKNPPRQGEGHDERGDYGRTDPSYDAPEDYGDIKNQT